jgi:hypothetical protein
MRCSVFAMRLGGCTIALINLQYELVNPPNEAEGGFKFGRGTNFHVERVEFGDPGIRTNDEVLTREDGERFGRDYIDGRTITFTINLLTYNDNAALLYAQMERAWRTNDTGAGPSRQRAGVMSRLRMNRHGRPKFVYGRPRNIAATTGRVDQGWVPVTCTFKTESHRYYEDALKQNSITPVPPSSGGFTFPIIFPLTTVPMSTQADIVHVEGDEDSFLVNRIDGPIVNPLIEVVGYWFVQCNITLLTGEYLEIDPRPWQRTVRKNGNIPMRGIFTPSSRRLSGQWLPPGVHQVVLKGTDPTGTARLTTSWHNTYTSW